MQGWKKSGGNEVVGSVSRQTHCNERLLVSEALFLVLLLLGSSTQRLYSSSFHLLLVKVIFFARAINIYMKAHLRFLCV